MFIHFQKNETYWRRVVDKKAKYKFMHLRESRSDRFSLKILGLRLKFIELIENTSPELWNLNYFKDLSEKVLFPAMNMISMNVMQIIPISHLAQPIHNHIEHRSIAIEVSVAA